MASMTVPERISDFLSQRQERMYCDTCIQERLGLKWRQQVQLITATLAVTAAFQRGFNKCCTCEVVKQVTHATAGGHSPSTATDHNLSAGSAPRRKRLDGRSGAGLAQGADCTVTSVNGISARSHDTN